jgi:uncharacterized membrane protein YvlD (DUF360 family)
VYSVNACRSRVSTYSLFTSNAVRIVHSKFSLFYQPRSSTLSKSIAASNMYSRSFALQLRVITYGLFTSIVVSTMYLKLSLFSKGSSLTYYSRPSYLALCIFKVTSLLSEVITYDLFTSIAVSTILIVIALQLGVITYGLFRSIAVSN